MRAAVFDFDGVLVNSEPLHFSSLRDALRPEGLEITPEEYYGLYLAYDDRGAIRRALEHHGQPADRERIEALTRRKEGCFAAVLRDIPFFPGARELVRALAGEMPLAIASGARHTEIEQILLAGGLRDAFTAVVGAEDAPRTKPDPAPYLEAARLLSARAPGLRPEDCVAFEDSGPGIAAARTAGMRVVAVTHSYPAEKLRAAHRVVESLVGLDRDGLLELFAA
jgi:HAD superfamily hydrolase (TIGR01509 family)